MSDDLKVARFIASDFFNLKKNRIFQRIKMEIEQILLDVEFIIISKIAKNKKIKSENTLFFLSNYC